MSTPLDTPDDESPSALDPTDDTPESGDDEVEGPSPLESPAEYLVQACQDHQIVLLGDQRNVSQHLAVLRDSLAPLHGAGITNLAWEFTNTRAQEDLDALLAARSWDQRAGNDLFVDLLGAGFGYLEYAEIVRAAWTINQGLRAGQPPFRIVALGLPSYVEDPDLLDGRSAGELELRNWWLGGHYRDITAFHMANVLTNEVIRGGERALVYADTARTSTRLVEWIDGQSVTSLGNLLHRWMGAGAHRVLFHGAVDDGAAIERIEALIAAAPETESQFGIDVFRSTLGNVGVTDLIGCIDGTDTSFRLAEITDGYLFVEPRSTWRPTELIESLIGPHNVRAAERRYRALVPREAPYTLDELEDVRRAGHAAIADSWPALPEAEPDDAPKRRFGRRR